MIAAAALAIWLSRFGFDARYDPWWAEAEPQVEVPA